jgi:phenylalanyl-tRNA synthetase alpha chain
MLDQLNELYAAALAELKAVDTRQGLEDWHAHTIGRRGEVTLLLRRVGELPREERPAFGRRANEVKNELEVAYEEKEGQIKAAELEKSLRERSM